MSERLAQELRELAEQLDEHAREGDTPDVTGPLQRLDQVIAHIEKAWSGSNMGYQSRVYYPDFEAPPPGAHFDSEWGFLGTFHGTTGDWREYQFDYVVGYVYEQAGDPSLDPPADLATQAEVAWSNAQPEVVSILSAYLDEREDALIEGLKTEAEQVTSLTEAQAAQALVGQIGTKMIRDHTAFSQGFMAAPHQVVEARVISIRSRFHACSTLAEVAKRGASHMDRVEAAGRDRTSVRAAGTTAGDRVFIGHGRSPLWRELKDFVESRLGLTYDEFNRVPIAGTTNIARLSEMLDNAGIAFLILTAEDQTAEGEGRARQNVVHEAGLFQGRLGFARAILLLEEGCDEFSNIQGLGQLRFPQGQIPACFEEVRQVLEREGFLET